MLTSHRPIRRFHVIVMLWTLKESTKSVMHMQSCAFAHKTNIVFFMLSLSSSSWLLKLPSDKIPCSRGRRVKWGAYGSVDQLI